MRNFTWFVQYDYGHNMHTNYMECTIHMETINLQFHSTSSKKWSLLRNADMCQDNIKMETEKHNVKM
jgi:hypothetical protein